MTNNEYIKEKQKEKFDLYWEKKVKKLPNSSAIVSHCTIEIHGTEYYFKKVRKYWGTEYCVICKKKMSYSNDKKYLGRKEYSKNEFKDIFINYDEYKKELRRVLHRPRYDIEYSGESRKNNIAKMYYLQQEYSLAFLRYLGCDVESEKKRLKFTKEEIRRYVINKKKNGSLASRYFEFVCYETKKLRCLLECKISTILLRPEEKCFIDYCKLSGFDNLHDLLLIPFYSLTLLQEFGQELIELVIMDIKSFIEKFIITE